MRSAAQLAEANGYAVRPAAHVHAYGLHDAQSNRSADRRRGLRTGLLYAHAVAFQSLDGLGRAPSKHRKAVEVELIDPARLSA